MRIWQKTDQGKVRKENQDNCLTASSGAYTVAVVCDSMGGAAAGQVASFLAAGTFIETLQAELEDDLPMEAVTEAGLTAVDKANQVVHARSVDEEACRGMGTTLVAAICRDTDAVVLNVGDSRAYLINAEGIRAISRDHSLVQEMVESGDITAEEARTHPNRNLITRALGTDSRVVCDAFQQTLAEGDYLLLCSDGLVNTVTEQEMLYEVIHGEDMDTCLDRLMAIAMDRGAPDNVTIVLMAYTKEVEQ